MKGEKRTKAILKGISNYLTFFLLVAFVTTCCMLLFLSVFTNNLGIALTEENIQMAAKLTFGNVLLLSFIFSLVDFIRRKITVERPARKITEAAEKIMQGDFSIRIEKQTGDQIFGSIIDCFNNMARELEGVETLRTDFIANVSHEMKTPLSVIKNYSSLLLEKELPHDKRIEYAKGISNNAKKLSDMMTNILKLNRLENQQIFPKTENYNLTEQLCECILQFEETWEKKNIDLDADLKEDVFINADRELLEIVWNNLLSNAFKFTDEGGKVSLSLTAKDGKISVTVSDTGCGISTDVGKHIFEKFYQGDTSHATSGNGLGLALVKKIIDITKGEIKVESELGVGSSFTVVLF